MQEDYDMQFFHKYICERLEAFRHKEIKNLMILMPPQHGKSELATRMFPTWLIGQLPDTRIGIVTYNDTFARKFNRQIQRNIDNEKYIWAFPNVKLSGSKLSNPDDTNFYARNANELEIVNHKGSIITVGRDGQIVGLPIDVLILDDLYKSREEAVSQSVNEKIHTDYREVFKTRLHNDSQQLLMNTRWDRNDLAGRILRDDPDEWEVIKFPAVRTSDECMYDPRPLGAALWPGRHSLERMLKVQKDNEVTFTSLYQQDPQPNSSVLCIKNMTIINEWPSHLDNKSYGLDFGFTNDPTALIRCAYDEVEGRKRAFFHQMTYAPGIPMHMIADLLRADGYVDGTPVYCDHALSQMEELRRLGILSIPAIKGEGSIASGLLKINEYEIHVTASSVGMINERSNYQYKVYGELITNEPADGDDHCWDAARYNCYSRTFARR